jgi:enoyl-CoA hydratase/carnithine racemase
LVRANPVANSRPEGHGAAHPLVSRAEDVRAVDSFGPAGGSSSTGPERRLHPRFLDDALLGPRFQDLTSATAPNVGYNCGMSEHETITVHLDDEGVATVTLDRPGVLNAFNARMVAELHELWRSMRHDDAVRCIVLTGSGDRAFCTGIDRTEQIDDGAGGARPTADHDADRVAGFGSTPFHFDDPGEKLGPKTNDLWKPVIAAVNGMACGGAFYMLGECDILIAAEHATFFDPHVTFGMTATFEPLHMMHKMPFGELMRMSLVGSHERISAARAYEIGMVTEVVPGDELLGAARSLARVIASAPQRAVQGTLRSMWAGLELTRSQALAQGWALIGLGNDDESLAEGQRAFASGRRITPRIR